MQTNSTGADKDLLELIRKGTIDIPDPQILDQPESWKQIIQPSSLDLRVGNTAWRMKGSTRPHVGESVLDLVKEYSLEQIDLRDGAQLFRDEVYIVALQEMLNLDSYGSFHANAKSSSGRNDLQVRLIADKNNNYDSVTGAGQKMLFNEVISHSFHPILKTGTTLNQLRYAVGDYVMPDDEIRSVMGIRPMVYDKEGNSLPPDQARINHGIMLTADLNGTHTDSEIIGYRAKKSGTPLLDLQKVKGHLIHDFFDVITVPKNKEITLEPGYFYLLSTNEGLSFPPTIAGRLKEHDHRVGNFTSHYAGFFDPGFGFFPDQTAKQGNTVTLEVRVHNNPEIIRDGQPIAVMQLERMSSKPLMIYGQDKASNYTHQIGVKYGKHYREDSK